MVDIPKNKTENQEAKNPESKEKFPLNKWLYGAGVSTVGLLQWTVAIFLVIFPLTYWGREKSEKIDKAISWVEKSYEKFKDSHSTDHLKKKGNLGTALALSIPISWLLGHFGMLGSSVDGYKQAQVAENKFDNLGEQLTSLTDKHIIDSQEIARLNEKVAELQKTRPSHTEQIAQEKAVAGATAQHHQ